MISVFSWDRRTVTTEQTSSVEAVAAWVRTARQTGTLRKFIKTARRYRTIQIRAGTHRITATGPLPDDLKTAIDQIHGRTAARQLVTRQILTTPAKPIYSAMQSSLQ